MLKLHCFICGLLIISIKTLCAQSANFLWIQQNGETIYCQGLGIAVDTDDNLAITGVIGNKKEEWVNRSFI
jgi:hypothetical protein